MHYHGAAHRDQYASAFGDLRRALPILLIFILTVLCIFLSIMKADTESQLKRAEQGAVCGYDLTGTYSLYSGDSVSNSASAESAIYQASFDIREDGTGTWQLWISSVQKLSEFGPDSIPTGPLKVTSDPNGYQLFDGEGTCMGYVRAVFGTSENDVVVSIEVSDCSTYLQKTDSAVARQSAVS